MEPTTGSNPINNILGILLKFIYPIIPSVIIIGILFSGFVYTRGRVQVLTDSIDQSLVDLAQKKISLDVKVNQKVPVKMDLLLKDVIDVYSLIPSSVRIKDSVPVNTVVPVDTDVPVNQTIKINQTIPIDQTVTTSTSIPVVGQVNVSIPIKANIPVNLDIPINTTVHVKKDIPVNVTVPIDKDFAIDKTKIYIDPNKTIRINKELPVAITVPVSFSPEELNLKTQILAFHEIANLLRVSVLIPPKIINLD